MSEAFDLIAFRDFCARQPAGEEYDFWSIVDSPCGCAVTQFVHSLGLSSMKGEGDHIFARAHETIGEQLFDRPRTFSALASRLSNLIGEGGNG